MVWVQWGNRSWGGRLRCRDPRRGASNDKYNNAIYRYMYINIYIYIYIWRFIVCSLARLPPMGCSNSGQKHQRRPNIGFCTKRVQNRHYGAKLGRFFSKSRCASFLRHVPVWIMALDHQNHRRRPCPESKMNDQKCWLVPELSKLDSWPKFWKACIKRPKRVALLAYHHWNKR